MKATATTKSILSVFSLVIAVSANGATGDSEATATAGASAASAAASAPNAPASAASAAASAASAAASTAATKPAAAPATATMEPAALTTNEFYGMAFAVRDAMGMGFDTKLNLDADPEIWNVPTKKPNLDAYVSKDQKMTFDFGSRKDGGYETITTSKITNRTIMTVFKNKKPTSQTIVGAYGAYTATEAFCEVLRERTKSTDFNDLAAKAVMCTNFYARTESPKVDMNAHIKTHRENILRMTNSPAKAFVDKERSQYESSEAVRRAEEAWKNPSIPNISAIFADPAIKPRTIVNRSKPLRPPPLTEDVKDRQAINDLADVCGRLWGDSTSGKESAVAPSTATKQPVKQ